MTIDECVESWINGNRSDVVDQILGLDSPAEIAFCTGWFVMKLQASDWVETRVFLDMLAARTSG